VSSGILMSALRLSNVEMEYRAFDNIHLVVGIEGVFEVVLIDVLVFSN